MLTKECRTIRSCRLLDACCLWGSWKLFHSWNHFHEISFSLPLWHLDSVLALQLVFGHVFCCDFKASFLSLSLTPSVSRKISFATWHKTLARRDKMNSDKLPNSSWAQSVSASRWVNSNTMRLRLIFYNFAHDFQFLSAAQTNSGPKWKFSLWRLRHFSLSFSIFFVCPATAHSQRLADMHLNFNSGQGFFFV